ncbi:MAG: hypothetical protein JNJ54_15465 [Myxococcaceae bacterium]|nr:hypothetical protein [Myxococcaceae bacterium]
MLIGINARDDGGVESDGGSGGSLAGGTAGGVAGGTAGGSVAGGTAGGSVTGGTAGGSVAGGTAGGSVAGGTAGGSVAGGTAGGSVAGGTAGGSVAGGTAGGTAGGSVAGGTAGGSVAGGTAGGSVAGGTAGGSVAGGTAGGSVAGGTAGGSVAGGTAGGTAGFVFELQAPLCLEPGEPTTVQVRALNVGGSIGTAVAVVVIPSAFSIQSTGGCSPAGSAPDASWWSCDGGAVAPGSLTTLGSFQLQAPAQPGLYAYEANDATSDGGVRVFTGVTALGTLALDPTTGGRWDAGACQGPGVMSLAACMPGDLVRDTLEFLPDASVRSDDGIPATWSQSPTRRNVCFQSFGPFGGNFFRGVALGPRCFGGVTDSWVTGERFIAAWEMCF